MIAAFGCRCLGAYSVNAGFEEIVQRFVLFWVVNEVRVIGYCIKRTQGVDSGNRSKEEKR